MRRKGPLLFTFVAVVLALTAAWGSQRWLNAQARQAAAIRIPDAKVVVAAGDLASGQKLEGFHLTTISWPRASLPPGHFSKTDKLVGRVMAGPVVKGEVILPSKLAKEGLSGGLSAVVPPGARAVTVRVNEVIGVAGFLQSGDRVDVYVTVNTGQYTKDPVSRMILQDVKVLAVGEQVQEQTGPAKGAKSAKVNKVTVVTLQVEPDQGEKLALSSSEGNILLALRNQGDRTAAPTPGVRMTSIMPLPAVVKPEVMKAPEPAPQKKAEEKKSTPAPAQVQQGPQVEVIKGVTRSIQPLS